MAAITIVYDFKFSLTVKKRNGKTYKSHTVMGVGFNYLNALWRSEEHTSELQSQPRHVNTVMVCRIAMAIKDGQSVSLKLSDHLPILPEDLNKGL